MDRHPDILGDGYWSQTLRLRDDDEGEVVATLVGKTAPLPSKKAVLYLHGFVDYFFQTEMAEAYRNAGINFYALDLRKYGRSLRPHQTPNLCRELDEYFEELDEAVRVIRADGNEALLLNGHSTGGLLACLYAHARRDERTIDALFLNSPFFDFNASWVSRKVLMYAASSLGRASPKLEVPGAKLSPLYGQSIHRDHRGAWDFRVDWKPVEGFPVRAGWLRAIHDGHRRLHAGLDVRCPVLLMCSIASSHAKVWDDELLRTDAVLDVEHINRHALDVGRHVTRIQIEDGMHDLMLSAPVVRERVLGELMRWCRVYFA